MNSVSILAPHVIAKIAAGEVVDRPASVVKELVENAIDAEASAIEVHLKDAGKELIHIKDNGHGITKDDLGQLFQRHATSKITAIEDLERLGSMGFRGEALYSIAAVSDVTLRSQRQGTKDAWTAHVRGGERLDIEPAAPSSPGTEIKVAELFYNLPARRKFLKNNSSEASHIAGTVLPYALIYPEKHFLLTHAGRAMLDLKPARSRLDRVAAALGLDIKDLLETSQSFPEDGLNVDIVLGTINVQRPRRNLQFTFINKRPVESKAVSFAMNDVYRALLPPGVYPAFIVNIQLDPARVDVNIHPSKREVRIKDDARICSILRHMSHATLMEQGDARLVNPMELAPPIHSAPAAHMTSSSYTTPSPAFEGVPADKIFFAPGQLRDLRLSPAQAAPDLFHDPTDNMQTRFARARHIGAFLNKYLLFEEGTSLFLVDQHAAQERIMFEKIERQILDRAIETQPLLTPLLLKISVQEHLAWEEAREALQDVGIDTDLFDPETLAVHSQPKIFKNIEQTIRTLLAGDAVSRTDRSAIARRACKASIVTGDHLKPMQVDHQRQELLACRDPFVCPHGRPTIIELKESFLDRQFLRTS